MATVSTPVHAFLASLIGGTACKGSQDLTIGLSVAGFEMVLPFIGVQPNTANISAGWEIYAYRSTDGGANYETVASISASIARAQNVKDSRTLRIESGFWLVRIISGSGTTTGATWSFAIGTMDVLTAINNA